MGAPSGDRSADYTATPMPVTEESFRPWVEENFLQLSAAMELLSKGFLPKTYVAPVKPFDGMKRYADGTDWNPGAGEGEYIYYAGAWHKCG